MAGTFLNIAGFHAGFSVLPSPSDLIYSAAAYPQIITPAMAADRADLSDLHFKDTDRHLLKLRQTENGLAADYLHKRRNGSFGLSKFFIPFQGAEWRRMLLAWQHQELRLHRGKKKGTPLKKIDIPKPALAENFRKYFSDYSGQLKGQMARFLEQGPYKEELSAEIEALNINTFSAELATPLALHLEMLKNQGLLGEEELMNYYHYLCQMLSIAGDYPLVLGEGIVSVAITPWDRDGKDDYFHQIPPAAFGDPSIQIFEIRLPNSEIAVVFAMRTYLRLATDKVEVLYDGTDWIPQKDHWLIEQYMVPLFDIFFEHAYRFAADRVIESRAALYLGWVNGYIPLCEPPSPESVATLPEETFFSQKAGGDRVVNVHRHHHPHAELFEKEEGSYEAMRLVAGATLLWIHPQFQASLGDHASFLLNREIDPDPDPSKAMEYTFAFSANTGRSANYHFFNQITDGTKWYHLDAIGAGPTLRTRSGQEKRDGYMRLQEAQSRFYLTNLMHYLGLRTSLGVAVVNLNLPRTGDYKTETTFHNRAIVYEMRREQLRLDQLNSPNWRFVIDIVKNKIALELKKEKLTDEEYVIFLAETFGEQLAIMRFYGFDHGLSGIPGQKQARTTQLHPGNPSLVGEIKDFDAARLTRDRDMLDRRYIGGEDNFSDGDLNFKNIKRMQREWKKNDPKNSKIWLHTLLNIAPEVDFYSLFQAAYKKKRLALESSGIDPAQKIREFNVNYWNPYMRSLKRIRSG